MCILSFLRALLSKKLAARSRKIDFVIQLVQYCDALMFQEVHGHEAGMAEALHWFDRDWIVRTNPSSDRNVGGLVSMLMKEAFSVETRTDEGTVVVPGRVSRMCVHTEAACACPWNVHNFSLTQSQMKLIEAKIETDVRRAEHDPTISLYSFQATSTSPRLATHQ